MIIVLITIIFFIDYCQVMVYFIQATRRAIVDNVLYFCITKSSVNKVEGKKLLYKKTTDVIRLEQKVHKHKQSNLPTLY